MDCARGAWIKLAGRSVDRKSYLGSVRSPPRDGSDSRAEGADNHDQIVDACGALAPAIAAIVGFGAMSALKRLTPLLCFLLSACSVWPETSVGPPAAPPENPLTDNAQRTGLTRAANNAHLTGPLEMSSVRKTNHGPGSSFVCIRQVGSFSGKQQLPYAVFFDGDKYKGSRLSIIMEECELQTYVPVQRLDDQSSRPEPCIAGCVPGKPY
ncbi:hypothetical protein ABIB06_005432 [Bradyrhizobium sp. LB8.2]